MQSYVEALLFCFTVEGTPWEKIFFLLVSLPPSLKLNLQFLPLLFPLVPLRLFPHIPQLLPCGCCVYFSLSKLLDIIGIFVRFFEVEVEYGPLYT